MCSLDGKKQGLVAIRSNISVIVFQYGKEFRELGVLADQPRGLYMRMHF